MHEVRNQGTQQVDAAGSVPEQRAPAEDLAAEYSKLTLGDRLQYFAATKLHPSLHNALAQALPYLPAIPDALRGITG